MDGNEKKEKISNFLGIKPDAVFILSACIVKDPASPTGLGFRSTTYNDLDNNGLLGGGEARVRAGKELADVFSDAIIVTDSFFPTDPQGAPTHALVMAKELEILGVSKERIVLEENSTNTVTEMVEMVKMASKNNWNYIAVVTGDYHVPRAQEVFDRLPILMSLDDDFLATFGLWKGKVIFVSAEDILSILDENYHTVVENLHKNPLYQKRLESETKGLRDLKAGKYRV